MSLNLLGLWLAKERYLSRSIKTVWSPEKSKKGSWTFQQTAQCGLKADRPELGKKFHCVEQMLVAKGCV